MGFLTILNTIAMVVGYIILVLVILFLVWLLISMIKDKQQRKKWDRERTDKEKTAEILAKEGIKAEEKPVVSESVQLEETKRSLETEEQTEKKEEEVDDKGQLKIVD
jgi:heme/copper-type cytochrome/quinol oxidase subunit 1|tara:strand:- start:22 stop:342 length:321 start_codon:yes stop_codon:yes gene_type:complete